MKIIKTETTVYEAFDGKTFDKEWECQSYEAANLEKYTRKKLKNFDIYFPLDEYGCTFTAFKVSSEDDYKLLMNYLEADHADIYNAEDGYLGEGFYVVVFPGADWCELHKLDDIIADWNKTLVYIINTISTMEV